MKKRILSSILSLALCLSLLPTAALAAESESYPNPGDLNMQTVPGDGQITVTWAALDDVGTDTVERYTVYCCIEDEEPIAEAEYTGAGSHTFTGLTNGVEYSVGVDAEYGSEYSVGYEDYETPDGALKITTVTAEKGSLTVNWTAPESDGSAVITGYEVTVARADEPSRRTTVNAEADAVSCTVDNLAGGMNYTVAVRVIYEDGDRIDSAPADVYVPFNVANIWLGDVRVTDANKNDVLGDADEGATVTYDPDTNTLTLNNADITGGESSSDGIYAVGDLNIELEGTNSVTALAAKDSYGIYVSGDLSISGSGSLTATADSAEDTDAFSAGILVTGDLTLNSGSVTAIGGTSTGDTAFSGGVYTVGDLVLKDGRLTATGKDAEAGETGLGFSAGVYTTGDLALEGGSLTATGGSVKGYFAQSEGVFTVGDFSQDSGSLTATGGDASVDENASAPDGDASVSPYATSVGIFITGTYYMWGGSVTAAGGHADGPVAYSAGVASKGDLSLHDGSLVATGGTAEGDYALSAGIEIASVDEEAYLNLAVYIGSLKATGGAAVGVTEAESAGVYAERSGLYIYGGEDGIPVVNLTGGAAIVTSEDEADEPYASSNGIRVYGGDLEIQDGILTVTGGERTETAEGDAYAAFVQAYVNEEGDSYGGKLDMAEGVTVLASEGGSIQKLEGEDGAPYTIVGADGGDSNSVVFESQNAAYDIWVGEVQVTAENRTDVLEDGTVSYAPETNTLTLNGADIVGGDGIYAVGDLNIELEGTNSVAGLPYADYAYGICVRGNLSISGSGNLTVTACTAERSYGIYVRDDMSISGSGSLTVTADTAERSHGIYVTGDLSISGSGSVTATAGAAEGDYVFSIGIRVTGDFTLNSGSVTAVGGTAKGDYVLSTGIYATNFVQNGGSLNATGKEAEAAENNLGFSVGVYAANFVQNGGSLNATADIAKGAYAQSQSVFTEGDFAMYDGSLTTSGGAATSNSTAEDAFAASNGVYTGGSFAMYGGSLTATGDSATGLRSAYSIGVATKNGLDLYGGSLKTTGGIAEGDHAQSYGIEASHPEDDYLNLAVRDGYLEATGGQAVGGTKSRSAGISMNNNGGLYIYGSEDGDPVVKLTGGTASVASGNEADEPYASSNGVYVDGDVEINAGDVTITGGTWEGFDGDGWAIYAEADMEYDDDGNVINITGGNVTIDCKNIKLVPSPGHGFIATKATIAGGDDDSGAIFAESSIKIGTTLTISDPEGGIIDTTERGAVILESAEEGAAQAKSVTIGLLLRKVSFVIDGSSSTSAADVPNGMSLNDAYADMIEKAGKTDFSELLNTAKDGYIFQGFYTDSGERFDFDTAVNEDITLTAKWLRNSYSGSGSSIKTETTKNEDGSTTTTTTNNFTGTVTETTETTDGVTGTIVTDRNGDVTEVSAKIPAAAAEDAEKNGNTVTLPVKVTAAGKAENAVEIEVDVPTGGAKVEIPVEDATPGTVVVIVNKDGAEKIVKTSVVSQNGVVVTLENDATVKVIDNSKQFTDVHPVEHWAEEAIDFVVAREIYSGTSATTFHPDNAMTRGMLAVVLHNLEDNPDHAFDDVFHDVAEGSWYEDAIHWAAENGIVSGYGNGLYGPNDNITREQFAVMLWRYAGSPDSSHVLSHFIDADQISDYASVALAWANENGIINGKGGGILDPKGDATRAEVAQMLKNYLCSRSN